MQRVLFFVSGLLLLFQISGKAQAQIHVAYSPVIDSLISHVTQSSVSLRVRQLSGDTSVIVGGETKTISTRNFQYNSIQNIAAQFVLEKFREYGYQARYQDYSSTGRNVLGWKTGTKYPSQKYIICAHYDDMPVASLAPGADDNASGVVAVMEAARLLAGFPSEYTIEFAIWDEEEKGMVGSKAYADSAALNGEQIMGVLNYDMIAWDSNNDFKLTLGTNTLSQGLTGEYQDVMTLYAPVFTWSYTHIEASDHSSFWKKNYPAILVIEEYPGDFNAYYHTPQDKFGKLNLTFFTRMVQVAVAGLASEGWNCKMSLSHQPVLPCVGTGDQNLLLTAVSPRAIAGNDNKPRLYYSLNGGSYQFLLPDNITGNSFEYIIPGQPYGTTVSYYFAVQDQDGIIIETLSRGGKGVNPPGTVAPGSEYTYLVAPGYLQTGCSDTVPKTIPDLATIYDTIPVSFTGDVKDLNVTVDISHSLVSTLNLSLTGPDGTTINLSSDNGGSGSNLISTTFDDEAMISITGGTAPFNGSFKPEEPLNTFLEKEVTGNWILKIQDDAAGQVGTLLDWCITFNYSELNAGIGDKEISKGIRLGQNFPNPSPGLTSIPFELTNAGMVEIGLFDLYGRKISSLASNYFESGLNIVNADLSTLPAGIYFYRLQKGSGSETKALLIAR